MKTLSTTPGLLSRFKVLGSFNAQHFPPRPTLFSVLARQLNEALAEKYPSLDLDVTGLHIAEPWPVAAALITPENGMPRHYRLISPVDMLIQSYLDARPVTLIQGFHRLTGDTRERDPHPLPVHMDDVQTAINECAALLIDIWQHALTLFWSVGNGEGRSPFQWLSHVQQWGLQSTLADNLYVPALSNDQAASMAVVANFPDKDTRVKGTQETPLHACLVNIQALQAQGVERFQLPGVMLVTRQMKQRLLVLSYSLESGIEVFESLNDYATRMASRLQDTLEKPVFAWALHEPSGDFFTALSCTLLDQQLRVVQALGQTARREHWSALRLEQKLDAAVGMFPLFNEQDRPWLDHVMTKLPAWLKQASAQHLLAYSKLMIAQALFQQQAQGKTFLDGIDALPTFAEQQIRQRLDRDHPGADIDIARVEIHDLGVEVLTLPIFTDDTLPLTEFVLSYRGGWPVGLIGVQGRDATVLPDWFTADYARQLVDELDVGSQYIALIKRLLIDEPDEVARRKTLFKSQLSVQLPLFALEKLIKGEAGFTQQGWNIVNGLMRPDAHDTLEKSDLCVRPLGFIAYEGASTDYVANMFVLGPRQVDTGPFVLYQPFAPEPLQECATWAALFAAISDSEDLNYSVLQWLNDDARDVYADAGFARPHLEGVLLEGFLALLPRSPAMLSTQAVVGNYFDALFEANAQALLLLADKQTVTVAERRWLLVKKAGWALFNGLTFFVNGPLQKAAWLLQTLLSIDSTLHARLRGDKEAALESVIDLLLNISLALLQEGLNFRTLANDRRRLKVPVDEPLFSRYEEPNAPSVKPDKLPLITPEKRPDLTPSAVQDYSALAVSWFSPSQRLTGAQRLELETYEVPVDLTDATPIEVGELAGILTYQGVSYVRIANKTYCVARDAEGLHIQDVQHANRRGPRLMKEPSGRWQLDLRLGLKGGGPKARIKKLRDEKQKKVNELLQQAEVLKGQINDSERVLHVTQGLMDTAVDRRAAFLERFSVEFESWRLKMHDLINLLDKAEAISPLESRAKLLHECWVKLTLQHFKLQNYYELERQALPVFNSQEDFLEKLLDVAKQLTAGSVSTYETWIENLEKARDIEAKLFYNSALEVEALRHVHGRPLPKDSALRELKHMEDQEYFDRHWSAVYLETLCELVIRRGGVNLSPEEQHAFNFFGSAALIDTAWSQLSLRMDNQLYSEDHIALLDRAIEQYYAAESVCGNLINLESEHFRNEYLAPIMQVVRHLRVFAESQLEKVIRDSESSSSEYEEPRPGSSRLAYAALSKKPATSGAPQRVIKTTTHQVLVGAPRESSAGQSGGVVDVTEGFGRLSVHTYKQVESGVWEEITQLRPAVQLATQARNLSRLEADGRRLLAKVDSAVETSRSSAMTSKIPVEIEEILEFKGKSLDEVAVQIDRIVTGVSTEPETLSETRKQAARALSEQLKAEAIKLRALGKSLRISMIKRLPPTGPNVEYLNTQGEIRIRRLGERKFLSRGQRKDYLQEYAIDDKQGAALWYAHFHYKALDTPTAAFDVAHLKTAAQRRLSEQALYSKAGTSQEVIEVYRAKLDTALAQRLFLLIP